MSNDEHIFEQIKSHVIKHITHQDAVNTNLYLDQKIFKKGDIIYSGQLVFPIEIDTIIVFADDEPLLNWAHKCRYLLFNAGNGHLYKEINANYPPYRFSKPTTYKSILNQVEFSPEEPLHFPEIPDVNQFKTINDNGRNKFALLFSGATENRHFNDLELLYRTLIYFHQFRPENIYVLNYDGTKNYSKDPFHPQPEYWPDSGTAYQLKINAAGTKAELNNVFDELKKRLKSEDLLFIHTNNHGDGPGMESGLKESRLDTYSEPAEYFSASEFAEKLNELNKFSQLLVVMEQCHSGGFGSLIAKNKSAAETCFIAACREDQKSIGGELHNPFTKEWIRSAGGMNRELFDGLNKSTKKELLWPPEVPLHFPTQKDNFFAAKTGSPADTPVFMEEPAGCSEKFNLAK